MEKTIPTSKPENKRIRTDIKRSTQSRQIGQCRYCGKATIKKISNIFICDACWVKVPKKIYI
jgi:ribosomal protein L37AE/L43A